MGFSFGNIAIAKDKPPLVIPDIGINHGGSIEVAKKMVRAAYEAGAALVKHQTHVVDDEMSPAAKQVIPGNSSDSIYDVMSSCSLTEEEEYEMMRYTESLGMEFISTPFSRAAADRLERFGVKAYKIGSGELNNLPLIEHIARFNKPMLVSTGMNDLASIRNTCDLLDSYSVPYALLHTTNLYPTTASQVRLGAFMQMIEHFPHVPIGLSDHTVNNNACLAATALGASLLERHFTDTRSREGNDISCSMDVDDLRSLIAGSREIFEMRGGTKEPLKEEQVTIDFAFATVVTIDSVTRGELFTDKNLWVKRPGTGSIPAKDYKSILGRKAAIDIANNTHLEWRMVE